MGKKLVVVQILPELEEGGVEGETVDFAVFLAKQGHCSIVISGGGRLVPTLEENGCIHLCWPGIGKKNFACFPYFFKLRNFLRNYAVDIVHLRSRLPAWIGYLAWKSLPFCQRPSLVTSFHGFYSINVYSRIMTRGERVIAVSQAIKDHILRHYGGDESKIALVHGGFSVADFQASQVSADRVDVLRQRWLGGDKGKKVIILPGRLTFLKGQEVLIESLALLKNKDVVCLFIGDREENPAYTQKLEKLVARKGLQKQVILTGHCDDMPAAMLLADIVISASSAQPEAFGKVMIEAMAMERAVIATAHGGSLETVVDGETGWLVPPGDAHAMAKALAEALSDGELRKRFGAAGRKRVLEFFTADAMCAKTEELYYELYEKRQKELRKEHFTVMQLLPELCSGGVERGTLEVGRFLAAHGQKSLVVSGGGRMVPQLEAEGSRHIQRKIGTKGPQALFHILPLRRMLVSNEVDILHMRSRMPAWVGYLAWLSLPRSQRPVLLTTFHGFYSINGYSAIMTKGDGVIAVSRAIKEHIAEYYGRTDHVQLIFRGVDVETFTPERVMAEEVNALRKAWQLTADIPVIALPGRLTRLKGQNFFIRSLARIKDCNFQAILIGDTEDNPFYTEELRQCIAEYDLTGRVHLVGHCRNMPAAFQLSDIVVSASSSEPEAFGRTTVEAMAMGCPVIATAHGGSLETVIDGENGWLVPPGDEEAMASALRQALELWQEDRQRFVEMGRLNRKRAQELFSAESMCGQTLDFYRQLLDEKLARCIKENEKQPITDFIDQKG